MVNQNLKLRRQCKQAKKLYELAIRLEFGFLEVATYLICLLLKDGIDALVYWSCTGPS
ncbi:hypothetical protein BDA96_01G116500 [Sorghum bicolor]|uniref:Uncharacterized protein n=2 Tax=Sorghum bicolor TaxID=4558 RepID=A0A921RYD2_SORBI|nr:hypothetical protein BDA96_01G116500 [Sorghum bicolor]OQU91093.1 hypothetical protein SORBI_3001G111850 [Sorghum bicolor]